MESSNIAAQAPEVKFPLWNALPVRLSPSLQRITSVASLIEAITCE